MRQTQQNQENKKTRTFFSILFTIDLIIFCISILVGQFWKLNGWAEFLEQGILLNHITATGIVTITAFMIAKAK